MESFETDALGSNLTSPVLSEPVPIQMIPLLSMNIAPGPEFTSFIGYPVLVLYVLPTIQCWSVPPGTFTGVSSHMPKFVPIYKLGPAEGIICEIKSWGSPSFVVKVSNKGEGNGCFFSIAASSCSSVLERKRLNPFWVPNHRLPDLSSVIAHMPLSARPCSIV